MTEAALPSLTLLLANPRGFCAGVDRAIQIVEQSLVKFGAPVYVRHEIVHNKYVVQSLRDKGAIFVKELDEIPAGTTSPIIFSAHGVPKSVVEDAQFKNFFYLDATCPLVSKVHRETERHFKNGNHIVMIGHKGHPEVIGTMGQLEEGAVTLIETVADVAALPEFVMPLAYVTQTTLSLDETREIIEALQARFPTIAGPMKEDICYATTNRQNAVKVIAERADAVIVIGAPNSSNSNRLVEAARIAGAEKAMLVQRAAEIDWSWMDGVKVLGLTAGASAPEILIEEVIDALKARYNVRQEIITIIEENITFKLPKELSASSSAAVAA